MNKRNFIDLYLTVSTCILIIRTNNLKHQVEQRQHLEFIDLELFLVLFTVILKSVNCSTNRNKTFELLIIYSVS